MQEKRVKPPCPSEDTEQTWLFEWAEMQTGKYPELALMFHIPNGGSRHKAEAAKLKAMGVKRGVPDICLPVPRWKFCGLFIEMKKQHGGKVSQEQKEWRNALRRQGYCAIICNGFENARENIEIYLNLGGGKQ